MIRHHRKNITMGSQLRKHYSWVSHSNTIIVMASPDERTRHRYHSFKDETLISNLLVMNHVIWANYIFYLRLLCSEYGNSNIYLTKVKWYVFNPCSLLIFIGTINPNKKFYVMMIMSYTVLKLFPFYWDKADVKVFSIVTLITDSV